MSKNPNKKSLWAEFKEFINKGNAMALAVGTIIGGAFSGITKSVTNDLIMPLINIFMGGADFSELKFELPRIVPVYETVVDEVTGLETQVYVPHYLTYGNFISAVINFLIMAMVVFFIVKAMNTMMDATSSHLAEMVIEGATMGMTDMTKILREYENKNCSEQAIKLAKEIAEFEDKSIDSLKKYL